MGGLKSPIHKTYYGFSKAKLGDSFNDRYHSGTIQSGFHGYGFIYIYHELTMFCLKLCAIMLD
jgi:hypothetical protein